MQPIVPIHTTGHRELHQGIVYRAGVAVEYRCPGCGETHPLDRRDWDEARGRYAGRFCAATLPIRHSTRAYQNMRQRQRRAERKAGEQVA